jgi:plastocyanin
MDISEGAVMINLSRRRFLSHAAIGGLLTAAAPLTPRMAQAGGNNTRAKPTGVSFFGAGFYPMVAHVVAGTTLRFSNRGAQTLSMASAPHAPAKLGASVAANDDANVHFPKPGIYLIYDDSTTRFDGDVGQVVARKSSASYPRPAYAIVVATDKRGLGLEPQKPEVVIPESTMTFRPWSLVVTAGEAIHFDNEDGDMHVAMPASEPMLMPLSAHRESGPEGEAGLWLEKMNAFAPMKLPGNGGRATLTLSQPGVHHYFCPVHAVYDAQARTFAPLRSYGGYPFIMDGVIVVLPK